MTLTLALAGCALLVWPAANRRAQIQARIARLLPGSSPPAAVSTVVARTSALRPRLVATAAGFAVLAVVSWPLGLLAGGVVAVVLDRVLRRLEPAPVRRLRLARQRELPATLDLLAVALRAGLPMDQAIDVVAEAMDGPLTDDLRRVASATRLGSDVAGAWAPYAADVVWGPVARAVGRSAASGSALAETCERVAQDRRGDRSQRAESAARQASVVAMAPLGLCFLPAFMCIGVLPVITGLLSGVLH